MNLDPAEVNHGSRDTQMPEIRIDIGARSVIRDGDIWSVPEGQTRSRGPLDIDEGGELILEADAELILE